MTTLAIERLSPLCPECGDPLVLNGAKEKSPRHYLGCYDVRCSRCHTLVAARFYRQQPPEEAGR